MEWRQVMRTGFEYDRWANRRWLFSLGGFKAHMGQAQEVLEHILGSQRVWLSRCGLITEHENENLALQDLFDGVTQTWIHLIEMTDPDELIIYENSRGEEFTQTFSQIAMHVVNHGTYHRGQLRGLAEADGYKTFPETDLILYLRENENQPVS